MCKGNRIDKKNMKYKMKIVIDVDVVNTEQPKIIVDLVILRGKGGRENVYK